MGGTARRVAAQVLLLACVLALVATSPGSDDIQTGTQFDLELSAAEPTTEFDVELELTAEAFEEPFERPLTFGAGANSTIVPQPRPTDGDVELPTVTSSVRQLGQDGEPLDASEQAEPGTTVVHTADCPDHDPCILRFRVEFSRHGGGELPVIARVSIGAGAKYEDRPDGADVQLRHTFDVASPQPVARDHDQTIRAVDGQVVTFTRAPSATAATIQVAAPNREPDRSTPGDVELVPLDEGPRLVVPVGFTTDVDPFVGCTATAPCMREYTIEVLADPPPDRPFLQFRVADFIDVDVGPSTLRVEDPVAEGQETGTVTVGGDADARIERTLEVVVDHGGGDPEDVANPTLERVWVLLEVEASGLEEGSVEAHLIAPLSPSLPRSGVRVLDPDRPAATVARILVEDLRFLDMIQGTPVVVSLERHDGGPVEVRWTLRGVVGEASPDLPPGTTVQFPPEDE